MTCLKCIACAGWCQCVPRQHPLRVPALAIGSAAQALFYSGATPETAEWKCQPAVGRSFPAKAGTAWEAALWWPPAEALAKALWPEWAAQHCRRGRHPDAPALALLNLAQICLFAAATCDAALLGHTPMLMAWGQEGGSWAAWGGWLAAAYAWENVAEWVWHRVMHFPWLYRNVHHLHHFNKSPEPFDDMLIHPVEAVGYYIILYSPAFLFPMHVSVFLAYMAIMGVTGVLDHCGAVLGLPLSLYDTRHHDHHHELVDVNFGFPSAAIDVLCGTFHGECCGRRILAKRHVY